MGADDALTGMGSSALSASARDGERRLVERFLASRDEEAFRALFRDATPAVLGFLRRLSRDEAEAEELLQETWARGLARLGAFRHDSSLATWLRGIALNCWRESRRGRDRLVPLAEGAGEGPDPGAASFAEVETAALARAVASLPDGYRAVLVLHDVEGYTHDEIAARLDLSPGTSKSQLSRARALLRRRLLPGGPR